MFASLLPGMLGVSVTPLQAVELAARHGFAGVDMVSEALLKLSGDDIAQVRERLNETGVRPGYFSLLPNRIPVADNEWEASVAQWSQVAHIANQLGYSRAAIVLLPFHETLEREAAMEEHVARLRKSAPILAEQGVRLGLEYVAAPSRRAPYATHTAYNLAGTLELLERAGCDNLGLLLDTFHWHGAGESVADLEALTNDQIVLVHVNDAPDIPLGEQVVTERALPCETGVIDSAGFFGALRKIGYDGPVTCEPMPAALKRIGAANDDELLRTVKLVMDKVLK